MAMYIHTIPLEATVARKKTRMDECWARGSAVAGWGDLGNVVCGFSEVRVRCFSYCGVQGTGGVRLPIRARALWQARPRFVCQQATLSDRKFSGDAWSKCRTIVPRIAWQ